MTEANQDWIFETPRHALPHADPLWPRIAPAPRRHTILLVMLLALGCTFAPQASAQAPQPDTRQSTVRGTVINAVTHEPIGRALVSSSDNRYATLTDGEGHFEFTMPKPGTEMVLADQSTYRISMIDLGPNWLNARKPGFLDDPTGRSQVEATPGGDLTISLMPEAVIKGRVISSESDPPIGITVQILSRQIQDGEPHWVQAGSDRANSNGEFRFAELLPGAYKLVTSELLDNDPAVAVPGGQLYGFPPVYYPAGTDFAAAGTIQLAAGQIFQADLTVARQPYYPVRIPVTNAELNAGINITVSAHGHRGPGYSLGFNAEKQRIEGSLPNGSYLVEALTFGQNSAAGSANLAVAGAMAESPGITLIRGSSIVLNVKEAFTSTVWNGSSASWSVGGRSFRLHGPRLYLQVRAESADDFGPQRGASLLRPPTGPNDDSLVLENLAPGRYWLRLSSSRGYVAAATMGGVDLLRQQLVVGPGSTEPIEITMRDDNAEIDGTLTGTASVPAQAGEYPSPYPGASARPVAWSPLAWIYCVPLPDSPGEFQHLGVSPEGKFNSTTMVPGTYRVLAFKNQQPYLPYRDAEAMRAYETKGQVVHLSAGQKTSVQVPIISSE